jgi:hypothetical protein
MSAVDTAHTAPTLHATVRWPAAAIAVSGLVVGIVTQILQGVLPHGWGVFANSGVMWALMSFALGAALPTARWALAGGALQLVIASITYYVSVDWFEGHSSDPRSAIIWSAAGIVAGSVFGLAGHVFTRRAAWRHLVLAPVAGVLFGEGIHLIWFVGNPDLRPAGITEVVLAVIIAGFCLTGSLRSRLPRASLLTAAVIIAATGLTLAAGKVIEAVFAAS